MQKASWGGRKEGLKLFLRSLISTLKMHRARTLQISIPDIGISDCGSFAHTRKASRPRPHPRGYIRPSGSMSSDRRQMRGSQVMSVGQM